MKAEYLIVIDKTKGIAIDGKGLVQLLQANSKITITDDIITYNQKKFNFSIGESQTFDSEYVVFDLTVDFQSEPTDEEIKDFDDLLRDIRTTIRPHIKSIETLWNDISFYCSQKAYPLIYKIENLTRKLLTKFMTINGGLDWEKKFVSSNVKNLANQKENKEKQSGKRPNDRSILYKLDFKDISDFLFDAYADNTKTENLQKLKRQTDIKYQDIESYIPRSNWNRYFNDAIEGLEDGQFKSIWDELYNYRCDVAHNNELTSEGLIRIKELINKIEPVLENAFNSINSIDSIDSYSAWLLSKENRNADSVTSEFIKNIAYSENLLFALTIMKFKGFSRFVPATLMIESLYKNNIIDLVEYKEIFSYRNQIFHGIKPINSTEIDYYLNNLNKLINSIEQVITNTIYSDFEQFKDKYIIDILSKTNKSDPKISASYKIEGISDMGFLRTESVCSIDTEIEIQYSDGTIENDTLKSTYDQGQYKGSYSTKLNKSFLPPEDESKEEAIPFPA